MSAVPRDPIDAEGCIAAVDSDWTVRWEAAGRAHGRALQRLLADTEAEVRERAEQRQRELSGSEQEPSHG